MRRCSRSHSPSILLVMSILAATLACAAPQAPPASGSVAAAPSVSPLLPIRNARIPIEGVLSGGQPTPEEIDEAARAGFRTVINLRAEGEPGYEWEAAAVERLGMRYVHIPVAGADGLTPDNVRRIDSALDEALADGPVLFHCASGNRIGAVLALRANWLDGVPAEQALDYGLASGMTRLTDTVSGLLTTPTPTAGE